MTETTPNSSEGASAQHNVANRKAQLDKALKETYKLDAEIAAATEKHIKHLRAEKSEIVKKLSGDINVSSKMFRLRYAPYKAEQDAINNDDEVTQDAIREMFEITPMGGQVNMLDAANGADSAPH